ncbi:Ndufs1, NADH-ubiquinone oxidoreductase 75kD subunit (775) [Infundibulicybe gibba]|nr:Ndufs1, NADH-ubiquinone oxidoreductase 75kD subunit (775) [Infundibulicybe gibba]
MLRLVSTVSRPSSTGLLGKASSIASSSARQADITLTVDGKEVTVPQVERSPKPVASCAMPAMPGSKVFTNSPLVHEARRRCDLQDQSMRYGSDRTRFHEIAGKRAIENKDLGPLVKTSMNRCIQCTRCVRFANEVAGVEELGTTGRGNDMQIGMYVEKTMDSELSGNIVDLCPLKNTESVDVMDAIGSNIRVDSRGVQVMRIQPRTNDDVNEEWISDKTRYAYDGLRFQRLTVPLVKQGDRFVSASWEDALTAIANGLAASGAQADEIQAVAGHLADTESLVALKDLVNRLGSDNLALDQDNGSKAPVHGVDVRSNYLFNSTIPGVEEADAILLVGTNPRHEAAVLNSRIRKSWLHTGLEVGLIGDRADTTYGYDYLGADAKALSDFITGTSPFAQKFKAAKRPLIIVGSSVTEHPDGAATFNQLARFVELNKTTLLTPEWNGFNVLQRAASRAAAYDIGFVPSKKASTTKPKFIYLLNADEVDPKSIPQDAFVVYQGHHGDLGAQLADVCLPAAAYTEKSTTWINTEGRSQLGRAAVPPPGASREDWKIIRALSEIVGSPLPYDDVLELRDRMWEISPTLAMAAQTAGAKISGAVFQKPIANFYQTDPISRSSVTMAQWENYGFSDVGKAPRRLRE